MMCYINSFVKFLASATVWCKQWYSKVHLYQSSNKEVSFNVTGASSTLGAASSTQVRGRKSVGFIAFDKYSTVPPIIAKCPEAVSLEIHDSYAALWYVSYSVPY